MANQDKLVSKCKCCSKDSKCPRDSYQDRHKMAEDFGCSEFQPCEVAPAERWQRRKGQCPDRYCSEGYPEKCDECIAAADKELTNTKPLKLAKVKAIQTNGYHICYTLKNACQELLDPANENAPEKMNIAVITLSGKVKHITLRQEDDGIYVYGDFEGMPDFVEYAQRRGKLNV